MTPLWLRFAARELRSGVKGFRIFLACLALGVAAIAAAMIRATAPQGGSPAATEESQSEMSFVPPLVWSASLTGISAPSITRMGHSMFS